jgi:GNAT superfamily N-acetyltransferase
MLLVENLSEENLEDVFKLCSWNRAFAPMDDPVLKEGIEVRRRWLIDILEQHGPCAKIAYLDGRPVAQIVFYPEEAIPYINDPRKDVILLQCIYSPFPKAQRKGVGAALMKNLVDECKSGLSSLGGRPCSFLVTRPFSHEGDLPLSEFYEKYGFRQGSQEMFLEIGRKYVERKTREYRPLPEDRDRIIVLYNPACEWGPFLAYKVEELCREIDPDLPVEIFNIWEKPEAFMKRPIDRVTSGRVIANAILLEGGVFWSDQNTFRRLLKEALDNTM